MNESPVFKFSLREDLKDDKRFLPTRGEPFATGYDVRAAMKDHKPLVVRPGEYVKIPLGFRSFPEEGWWFQLHPRSSTFIKKEMHALTGLIDCHFGLENCFLATYIPDQVVNKYKDLIINFGDAIGQLVPVKRVDMQVMEVSNEEYNDLSKNRFSVRTGGFGSTGI